MRIIKNVFLAIVLSIAAILITAIFIDKDYAVTREISINRPKQEVFDYIKYLKNQNEYSKWATMDPAMKKTYTGTDGTVGFISAWESENDEVGKGEQEIIKITEGERIDFELRFLEPFEAKEPAFLTTDAISENQTKVTWGFSGHMAYPSNIFLVFMDFEKMIGADLEYGLSKLKDKLEKK
jgi:hypothetical protein